MTAVQLLIFFFKRSEKLNSIRKLSITFHDVPSYPILIIGSIGMELARAVFWGNIKSISIRLLKKSLQKKKALIKEQKELNERLEKKDLKNL